MIHTPNDTPHEKDVSAIELLRHEVTKTDSKSRVLAFPLTLSPAKTAAFVPTLRQNIHSVIPLDFSWWLEMDYDIGVSICWIWTGHPGVSKIGRLFDSDLSILLSLLRQIDWSEQVNAAVDTVDAFEREALRAAQNKRRSLIAPGLTSLPSVALPEPGPFTLDEKREVHRVGLAKRLSKKKRTPLPQLPALSQGVHYPPAAPIDSTAFPEFAYTCSASSRPQWCKWESCASYSDLIRALLLRPLGEVRRVILFGLCWVNPTIEKVFLYNGQLRSLLPSSKTLKMTPDEFHKVFYEALRCCV